MSHVAVIKAACSSNQDNYEWEKYRRLLQRVIHMVPSVLLCCWHTLTQMQIWSPVCSHIYIHTMQLCRHTGSQCECILGTPSLTVGKTEGKEAGEAQCAGHMATERLIIPLTDAGWISFHLVSEQSNFTHQQLGKHESSNFYILLSHNPSW